jgi:hypothetical protein
LILTARPSTAATFAVAARSLRLLHAPAPGGSGTPTGEPVVASTAEAKRAPPVARAWKEFEPSPEPMAAEAK